VIDRARVAVAPAAALDAHARLLGALSAAFGVDFVPWSRDGAGADGVLALGADALGGADADAPLLVLAAADEAGRSSRAVVLTSAPELDRRLRGVALTPQDLGAAPVLDDGAVVLARAGDDAVWTLRPGPAPVHQVAAPLLDLGPTAPLRDALHDARGLALIALVAFLRAVAEPADVVEPPVRAAILFDDPNLRRPTYGHIDFAALVRHADAHDYHASMAMIPLDRLGAHAATVRLFRERADRLSLAFHGNNHEKRELMQPADLDAALVLCGQALRRIAAFERAEQLPVSHVMTAPHGMCAQSTARALGALPYDGLCAIHPLPWTEDPPADRPLAGWDPATFVEACPVLPRVPLDWGADGLALRAFLGHPIVLYGHHDDVAGGLEPLAAAAAAVNRMGDVAWTSLGAMAETNARVHRAGATAVVRPYANRLSVAPPSGATQVTVVAPSEGADAFAGWSLDGDAAITPFGESRPLDAADRLSLRLHSRWETPLTAVPSPRPRPWPAVRRVGTELRDRLAPLRG
jgi:hypothetical protein